MNAQGDLVGLATFIGVWVIVGALSIAVVAAFLTGWIDGPEDGDTWEDMT